jgi:hypothetical protein
MPQFEEVFVSNGIRLVPRAFVPLLVVGFIGLYNVAHHPRFEAIHTVDVVQLVASGVCFGVALVGVVAFFRGSRNS